MPSFPAKLGPGAFDTSLVGDPCPGQTGDLPASLALPGGGPPALGQDMAPASQLTASREGQGVVGGCREGSPVGVSLSFLPHPVSIQQSQAGCGGEETSGPQSGALVLVQAPGPPPSPGTSGAGLMPSVSQSTLSSLRAVPGHVLLSASCWSLLGSGIHTAVSPGTARGHAGSSPQCMGVQAVWGALLFSQGNWGDSSEKGWTLAHVGCLSPWLLVPALWLLGISVLGDRPFSLGGIFFLQPRLLQVGKRRPREKMQNQPQVVELVSGAAWIRISFG